MDAEKVKEFRQHQVKQVDKLLKEIEEDVQTLVVAYMGSNNMTNWSEEHPEARLWRRPLVNLKRLRGACNFLAKEENATR